jgi:hypothetical protein
LNVGVKVTVSPTFFVSVAGERVIESSVTGEKTNTAAVSVMEGCPAADAPIVAVPALTPVTVPLLSTEAMWG